MPTTATTRPVTLHSGAVTFVFIEFDEAVAEGNLHCHQEGVKLFSLFRQIMSPTIRTTWDIACTPHVQDKTGFQATIDDFSGTLDQTY